MLGSFLNTIAVDSFNENFDEEREEVRCAVNEIMTFNPKSIDINLNIMSYWEDKKFTHPYLYKLANVINSVPAIQVSVERCFSALKLILTDLRSNISADSLQKLLFLKLNEM